MLIFGGVSQEDLEWKNDPSNFFSGSPTSHHTFIYWFMVADTVDGRKILLSHGSLSPFFIRFLTSQVVWLAGFLNHQQYVSQEELEWNIIHLFLPMWISYHFSYSKTTVLVKKLHHQLNSVFFLVTARYPQAPENASTNQRFLRTH